MKKLMLTVVALCAAIASQAATANWKIAGSNIYNGTDSTDASAKYSGTAYIFDAGVTAQSSLYSLISEAVISGSSFDATKASGYVASGTVTSGLLPNTTAFAYGDQSVSSSDSNKYSFYFILLEDDNVYFSNVKDATANATATAKTVNLGNQAGSSAAPTTAGKYAGAGAWSSVPEPTSAMLLMLGLCGLALKRKNA